MKYIIIYFALVIATIGCKKGNNVSPTQPSLPQGNFLKIDNDLRNLSLNRAKGNTSNNPETHQFVLSEKDSCKNVAGFKNDNVELYVNIYDLDLSAQSYQLIRSSSPKSKSSASIMIRLMNDGSAIEAWSSTDSSGTVELFTSGAERFITFTNVKLNGGKIVSARIPY